MIVMIPKEQGQYLAEIIDLKAKRAERDARRRATQLPKWLVWWMRLSAVITVLGLIDFICEPTGTLTGLIGFAEFGLGVMSLTGAVRQGGEWLEKHEGGGGDAPR